MSGGVRGLRARRGSALILVLLMTLAVAALAVAAIFMTSSAGLLSRFYDKERLFGLAAESGLQLAVSRLRTDGEFAIADTGMTVVLSGVTVQDADGNAIPGANVFVYAMVTGDTTGNGSRTLTFVARAYDSFGTRHVRRMDVRQESITRYTLFVDSFPSNQELGPLAMRGRVHSNGNIISAQNTVYFDSVTAVGTINTGGDRRYEGGRADRVPAVPFPRDSTFAWMAATAATANLSYTASGNGRTRLEFVTFDLNNNGVIEAPESYVRIFVAASDAAQLMEADPPVQGSGSSSRHEWNNRIVQNQCGAFYLRSGRWHFFPVATHRQDWAWDIIEDDDGAEDFPDAPDDGDDDDADAVENILTLPTARCFPVGSPYLVNTERFTNNSGQINGGQSNRREPWGRRGPSGNRYGGSDTTFTRIIRTCTFDDDGECTGNTSLVGAWIGYAGTADPALPDSLRASHWPLHVSKNSNSRGLVNVTGDVYVSGVVRGQVTLRVGGTARLLDRLVYASDPNDPNVDACSNMLGLVATGSILLADSPMSRVRRFGRSGGSSNRFVRHMGPEERFSLHGYLLSTGGTIGVENPTAGLNNDGIMCPGSPGNQESSGGCFAHTGSAAMRRYSEFFDGNRTGLRPFPTPDRCMLTGRRPPFFPGGVGFTVLRTMELEPARANTNARIEVLLRSLRGRNLD